MRSTRVRMAAIAVKLDDERRRVTGDEKWMSYMFRSFFLEPAVRRAYEQAKAK